MFVSWVSMVPYVALLCLVYFVKTGTFAMLDDTVATSETIKTASEALIAIGNFVTETNLGNRVKKKSFSNDVRLLFIAGLEGTGHHGWSAIINECVKRNFCVPEMTLTSYLMRHHQRSNLMYGMYGAEETSAEVIPDLVGAYNILKQLAQSSEPHLYYIGLGSVMAADKQSGMMSYPNFNGHMKSLNNPDVHILAALAEAAGVDCRIIVLQRNSADIYRSDMEHHSYGKSLEPRILQVAAEEIRAQLSLLDRRFFSCADFDALRAIDEQQSNALMNFLHPQLQPIWKSMLALFDPPSSAGTGSSNFTIQSLIATEVAASEDFSNHHNTPAAMHRLTRAYHIYQLHVRNGLIADECAREE